MPRFDNQNAWAGAWWIFVVMVAALAGINRICNCVETVDRESRTHRIHLVEPRSTPTPEKRSGLKEL